MKAPTPGLALITVLAIGSISTARADDVHCPPNIGAVTIDGNVLIAAPCRLEGTIVKGNVLLYSGGSLIARDVHIDGNIQAEVADFVDVTDSFIGGSIQLNDMVGDLITIARNEVDGNIQLDRNRSRQQVLANVVIGDIQAFENSGGVAISDNDVDGNLQCKSNLPAPTGANNRVRGNKEDQCANLQPGNGALPADATVGGSQSTSTTGAVAAGNSQGGGGALDLLTLALLAGTLVRFGRRRS